MSKTRQISVTLPENLIDAIKAAVDNGEERSVSAYIARRLAPGMVMNQLFAEWDADRGMPSREDSSWAEGELARVTASVRSRSGAA